MRFIVVLLSLASCVRAPAQIVILDAPTRVLARAGETHQLRARVRDKDGLAMEPTEPLLWASSDDEVLAVDAHGLLTAHKSGLATISVNVGQVHAELNTRVAIVRAVALDPPGDVTLRMGESLRLRAIVSDDRGEPMPDVPVTWFAASPAVELAGGLVTAQAVGTTQVSASAGDKSTALRVSVKR